MIRQFLIDMALFVGRDTDVTAALKQGRRQQYYVTISQLKALLARSKPIRFPNGQEGFACLVGVFVWEESKAAQAPRTMLEMTGLHGETLYFEAELSAYDIGFEHGKADKQAELAQARGVNDRRLYHPLDNKSHREAVPSSRPKDAGPCVRYRWTVGVDRLADREYARGYAAGKCSLTKPAAKPLEASVQASMKNLTRKPKGNVECDLSGWAAQEPERLNPFEVPGRSTYKTW